jgi:poly(beta-D-mannuronate) lyase
MKSRQCCRSWLSPVLTAVALASGGANQIPLAQADANGTFRVSDTQELDAALKTAGPGDTLVMTDGIWKNVDLRFLGTGKPDAPITLRAQTPGKVILTGNSRLSIGGRYLVVEGLLFKDDAPTEEKSSPVISFRGDGKYSHHCRMTSCAVVDFSPPDKTRDTRWVSLYGTHHRVDHCHFANKTNLGTTLVVWLNDPPEHEPNHHRIDHNRFWHRPELGMNGGETIRIGTSGRSMLNSRTMVDNNYFYRCNGEGEIISNKSCENVYRANTFVQCEGALTLRHGNRCTVDGNFFLGNQVRLTGGVRVIGEDHQVINNYFSGLRGDDYRAALTLMEGIRESESSGYLQVKRARVAFNTFVDNRQTFNLGFGTGRPGQVMPPVDCVVANNVVSGGRSPLITVHDPDTKVRFEGNVFHGAELGIPAEAGFRELDSKLPDQTSTGNALKPEEAGPRWLEPGL